MSLLIRRLDGVWVIFFLLQRESIRVRSRVVCLCFTIEHVRRAPPLNVLSSIDVVLQNMERRWAALLQSATTDFVAKCDWGYYKVRQVLQSVIKVITKCDRLLQSATGYYKSVIKVITKCDRLLQSATVHWAAIVKKKSGGPNTKAVM